jgi:hypothetical protein
MPNTFIDHRDAWIRMSEIDYLGQFVKSWLAFNAWYRGAYHESQDRKIIDEVKWQGNPILSKLRPMLETESDEAEQLRAQIGLLHDRLESYELHSGKGADKKRITLRSVFLRDNPPTLRTRVHYGRKLMVERTAAEVKVDVRHIRSNATVFHYTQNKFDLRDLDALPDFQNKLTPKLQASLRQLYGEVAPKWIEDLTTYRDLDPNTREIKCGAFSFLCGKDALFAGVVEIIYQMRCTLFHGELIPAQGAVLCYEPAYRLVRRFLECVA